jgi:DNA repair exonuclease SbcCD ATPase subunit
MQLSAGDRRKFVETMLNLDIFSEMNKRVAAIASTTKDRLTAAKLEVTVAKERLRVRCEHITRLKADMAKRLAESTSAHDIERNELISQKTEIESNIVKIEQKITDSFSNAIELLESRRDKLKVVNTKANTKFKELEKKLQFFDVVAECPTCSQPINSEHKEFCINDLSTNLANVKLVVDKVYTDLTSVDSEIKGVKAEIEVQRKLDSDLKQSRIQLKNVIKDIDKLDKTVYNVSTDKEIVDTELKTASDIRQFLISQMETVSSIAVDLDYCDIANSVLKDSGIKAQIIGMYLPLINTTINNHLRDFGFFAKFSLDSEFNETILARGIDSRPYSSFSEGEKLRIDLAVLLAWRDVAKLQSSMSTNLFIFDEILDASMDISGSQAFLDILNKSNEINLFLVSHSADKWADSFRSTIKFAKIDGFTKIL